MTKMSKIPACLNFFAENRKIKVMFSPLGAILSDFTFVLVNPEKPIFKVSKSSLPRYAFVCFLTLFQFLRNPLTSWLTLKCHKSDIIGKDFSIKLVVFSNLKCLWFAHDLGDHCEQNRSQASLPQVYAPSDIRLTEQQPQALPLHVGLSTLSDSWKTGFKRPSWIEWSFPANDPLISGSKI